MDLLQSNIKKLYLKYLLAAFGSSIITSIYSLVDMAIVGQYHGAVGTASLAVVAPLWNLIYSLGLLTGVGGSIIFSTIKGKNNLDQDTPNKIFTSSLIFSLILGLVSWIILIFFDYQILLLFGGDSQTIPLAQKYILSIKFIFPLFLINQMLTCFIRNDNNPSLATIGILSGGLFNIVGDYVFVFTLNMGIFGAGLATSIGSVISFLVLMTHFISKKCTIKLKLTSSIKEYFINCKDISINGFSSFFVDVAMGILTILFNNQIMKYLNNDALAVYGTIINISTFVQACAYGVGQASQPIISTNYGAKNYSRIKQVLKYGIISSLIIGLFWVVLSFAFPNLYVYIFMKPTQEILNIASKIIRLYSISFILLPFNIYSTYYFQSILKPQTSFLISILRGFLISGLLIMLLPLIYPDLIWLSMPITELIIFNYALTRMIIFTKRLNN